MEKRRKRKEEKGKKGRRREREQRREAGGGGGGSMEEIVTCCLYRSGWDLVHKLTKWTCWQWSVSSCQDHASFPHSKPQCNLLVPLSDSMLGWNIKFAGFANNFFMCSVGWEHITSHPWLFPQKQQPGLQWIMHVEKLTSIKEERTETQISECHFKGAVSTNADWSLFRRLEAFKEIINISFQPHWQQTQDLLILIL